jgi:hypothetical protein
MSSLIPSSLAIADTSKHVYSRPTFQGQSRRVGPYRFLSDYALLPITIHGDFPYQAKSSRFDYTLLAAPSRDRLHKPDRDRSVRDRLGYPNRFSSDNVRSV